MARRLLSVLHGSLNAAGNGADTRHRLVVSHHRIRTSAMWLYEVFMEIHSADRKRICWAVSFLHEDHGAATTRTWPRTWGRRFCVLRRALGAGRLYQNLATNGYRLSPPWRRQKAEVTDAYKATRQYMHQKAAQEFFGCNCHFALLVAVCIVLPAEGNLAIRQGDEAMVGDGHAMV